MLQIGAGVIIGGLLRMRFGGAYIRGMDLLLIGMLRYFISI